MMYSGQRQTLPCFKAGDRVIQELENRLNPLKGQDDDGKLNIFIQK